MIEIKGWGKCISYIQLFGAAHQQPQEFFIITTTKQLATDKKGIKINYVIKKVIPVKFLDNRKTDIDIDA